GIAMLVQDEVPGYLTAYTITFGHETNMTMTTDTSLGFDLDNARVIFDGYATLTITGELLLKEATLLNDGDWLLIDGVLFMADGGPVVFDFSYDNGDMSVTVISGTLTANGEIISDWPL
ncbi:MAG: hypothetical protein FWD81_01520, partial [Methanomassiliicoccaceae archaeon]|nr:hypothetical protein [Methanomassiliicoccaceae archaeon]